MECQLQHPFTCMISSVTGSEKTCLIKQILQFSFPPPDRIVWINAQDHSVYHELK